MKMLSMLCEEQLSSMKEGKVVICDFVMTPNGAVLLSEPVSSIDYTCGYCNGIANHTPFLDPTRSDKRVWLCGNVNCDVYKKKTRFDTTHIQVIPKRALEWALFCENNGLGDLDHDIKFEKIEQTQGKIDYLFKFAAKPSGIIFMQGRSGSGKTYASLGVCELFTRRNTSAIFTTQTKMLSKWLEQEKMNYISKLESVNLLIVDDFGTGDVPPGFMKFFLDLINTRIRWSDRGTIITTNLDDKSFSDYCGEALNDRIKVGQKMVFNNPTRRKQIVL
jgi:DNA replication protein DnaC